MSKEEVGGNPLADYEECETDDTANNVRFDWLIEGIHKEECSPACDEGRHDENEEILHECLQVGKEISMRYGINTVVNFNQKVNPVRSLLVVCYKININIPYLSQKILRGIIVTSNGVNDDGEASLSHKSLDFFGERV